MKKIIVTNKYNNKKILYILQDFFNGLSSSMFFKALRKKDIKVNGKRITTNINIFENDIIEIYLNDKFLFKHLSLDIVYEDENILIANKPANIEVLSDTENSFTNIIQNHYNFNNNFPYPCHRLDRNTTGLIIYAKNQTALDILNKKIKNREIQKLYKCTVIGIFNKKEDLLTHFLFKDSKKSTVYISDIQKKDYKIIKTSYKVLNENIKDNLSLLEIKLHTGRTHQIRAHLAYIGHPILGDGKYGIYEYNKKFNQKIQDLTAYKLIFNFTSDAGILNYLNKKEISNKS